MSKSSRSFRNESDVVEASSFGEKLNFFIFQLNVHLDHFTKLTQLSAVPPAQGETAECSPKRAQ